MAGPESIILGRWSWIPGSPPRGARNDAAYDLDSRKYCGFSPGRNGARQHFGKTKYPSKSTQIQAPAPALPKAVFEDAELTSASSSPTREQECGCTYAHTKQDEDQAETEREGEVPLACLQRDGRGHGAGVATDIAADDDDRADLRDGAAERGEKRGQERAAPDDEQLQNGAAPGCAIDPQQVAIVRPQRRNAAMHQGHYDRGGKGRLRDDHGGGGEQQAREAERSRPCQKEVDREPDHDRRQPEQGVDQHDDDLLPSESADREGAAQRRSDEHGDHAG